MARELAFLLLLGAAPAALAQQPARQASAPRSAVVGGTVSGTWSASGSPYFVKRDLEVQDLTILPGVEVVSWPGVEIVVTGRLVANGTAARPVVFTSRRGARWEGLRFDHVPTGSSLTQCRIERSDSSGVHLQGSIVPLTGCEIVDNSTRPGEVGGGLRIEIDVPGLGFEAVDDCLIARNTSRGAGPSYSFAAGGGISARLAGNTLVLDGCRIEENVADGGVTPGLGGGVYVPGAGTGEALLMTDCAVEGNRAVGRNPTTSNPDGKAYGGGIAISRAALTMVRCSVRENQVLGLGVVSAYSESFALGGGLYCVSSGSSPVSLSNCLFAGNVAYASGSRSNMLFPYGGAVFLGAVPLAVITNCTIARNRASALSGPFSFFAPGIYTNSGSTVVESSILAANLRCQGSTPDACDAPVNGPQLSGTVTALYSDVQGGWPGTGNFSSEPIFVGTGTTYADLSLQPSSPCIDAGDPDPAFDDLSFPPSQGGVRNDEGMDGGQLAGGWIGSPAR